MFELMALAFAVFVLFVLGSILALVLKLAFKIAVIPLKLVAGLVLGVASLGLVAVAVPVVLLAIPLVVVVGVVCIPLLMIGFVCWLGIQTFSFVF